MSRASAGRQLGAFRGMPMTTKPSYAELERRVIKLEAEVARNARYAGINRSLFEIAAAVGSSANLSELFPAIHRSLSAIIDTTNFFIALYDGGRDTITFPYQIHLKKVELSYLTGVTGRDCLTARVLESRQPLLMTRTEIEQQRAETGWDVALEEIPESWLGVPLIARNTLIGAMVVQSYEGPSFYDATDVETLSAVAVQVATAIERKQIEERLQASVGRFRRIIENVKEISIQGYDRERRVTFWNPASEKIYGYSEQEALGNRLEDLIIPPAMRDAVIGMIDRWVAGGEAIPPGELLLVDKYGRDVPVFSSHVLCESAAGREMFCIDIDLRPIKQAELALRESELKHRTFFSAINDAVFVYPYREQGFAPFIEVNDIACRRYGYTREELLQLTVANMNSGNNTVLQGAAEYRRQLLEKGQLVFEAKHVKKSGEIFPVEINANIIEQGGEPVILAVVRDISERKNSEREREKLEDQLRQAQKLESIGRLAGGVAHDFNNMLGVIIGRTDMIMDDVMSSPFHDDLLEIHKAASRSADLTRQLLTFARKQSVSLQVLDLNEKVADIYTILRRLIGEAIELSWQPCGNLWSVKMDPGQVDQILTNLCVNGRDAITGTGRIVINLGNIVVPPDHEFRAQGVTPGQFVVLTVTDNGCGIEKEVLDNLFEPFFTTKATGRGTGLGLATLYGIVRQNHGFVEVKSSPGRGSRFSVYLPRCEAIGRQAAETVIPWLPPKKNMTVLLVEDEPAILTMTEAMLKRLGFQVMAVESPQKALALAAEATASIDILLSDIVMPEMDGWQLAEKIAVLHPGICRVLMSGYTEEIAGVTKMVAEKGVYFIQKPFTKHELSSKLGMIIMSE